MARSEFPLRRNLYVYSKGTREGFLRMQRQGIPRPLFSLQDSLARLVSARYRTLVRRLLADLRSRMRGASITLDSPEDDSLADLRSRMRGASITLDSPEDDSLAEMGEETRAENARVSGRASLLPVVRSLEEEWREEDMEELARLDEQFAGDVDAVLRKCQTTYLDRLMRDASDRLAGMIGGFSIDKRRFFDDNMAAIRALYVDDSLARIRGEGDIIKRRILERLTDYALGKDDSLRLDDITEMAYRKGEQLSRLFARDQIQRFNKSCTIATFKSAGVAKVKWVTSNDARVRSRSYTDRSGVFHRAHTALQGMVFDIDDLPLEIDDYNCRCGLVPVAWEDD